MQEFVYYGYQGNVLVAIDVTAAGDHNIIMLYAVLQLLKIRLL
jgi:hypothetical protein